MNHQNIISNDQVLFTRNNIFARQNLKIKLTKTRPITLNIKKKKQKKNKQTFLILMNAKRKPISHSNECKIL
jgi:hypothetical protein